MKIERVARDSWAIPQSCCVCGEPSTDGTPFATYVTLKRKFNTDWAGKLESVDTTSLDFKFPRCAACTRAHKAKSRRDTVSGLAYVALGIVGLGILRSVADYGLVSCASALIVWLVACVGIERLTTATWKRRTDADTQRRTGLPAVPVSIKRKSAQGIAPLIQFTFENEEYGEAFASANP